MLPEVTVIEGGYRGQRIRILAVLLPLQTFRIHLKSLNQGFPGGPVVKNLPANAGDTGSSPGPGRSHMPWSI